MAGAASFRPLELAWDGNLPPAAGDGGTVCLLDGVVHDLDRLAESLGIAPGRSPAATLATAYERRGEELLELIRGEFAIVVWDRRSRRGLIARDQLGARSLYLHGSGRTLRFASEVRQLLRALPRRPAPNDAVVAGWLSGDRTAGEDTPYAGVRQLPPGHCIRLDDEGWRVRRYWAPTYAPPLQLDRHEAAGAVRSGLERALRRRLGGHANAGVLLSGGLDSSSIAALAKRLEPETGTGVRAYSGGFPSHPRVDESALIDVHRTKLGLPGVRADLSGGSLLAGALRYVDRWKLPLGPPNHAVWEPLLRLAERDGITCLLDGEGGDEVLGAEDLAVAERLRRGRVLSALRLARRYPGAGDQPSLGFVLGLTAEFGAQGLLPTWLRRLTGRGSGPPAWLRPATARLVRPPTPWRGNGAPLWWSHLAHLLSDGPERLGVFEYLRHRAALAGSAPAHPFFDLDLLELVLRLPPELSYNPHLTRPLLRAGVRGLVPDEVRLRRRKSYFDPLIRDALGGADLPALRRLLGGREAEVGRYVDREAVRRTLLDVAPERRARTWAAEVWRLASVECWLRSQADPSFPERALADWGLADWGVHVGLDLGRR